MKFAVDKILDGIVTLENIETGEIVEVCVDFLPHNISEGSILVKEEGYYIVNKQIEEDRKKSLRERMERLKNLNNR